MPRSKLSVPTPAAVPLPPADDPATLVLRQFRQVFNAVKSHSQQVEKVAGIGGSQVWALSLVSGQPGIGISALAQAMSVHQSTASNLVRALIERDLLVAVKEGTDRRAVQLKVLPAGAALLEKIPAPIGGVLPDALRALPPRTLARLREDLAELVVRLDADERGAEIPLSDM